MAKFNFLKIIFAIVIGIIFAVVITVGIAAWYPSPDEQIKSETQPNEYLGSVCAPRADTQDVCIANGGVWADYTNDPTYPKPIPAGTPGGYCNYEAKCAPLREKYNRNVGIAMILIGLAGLGAGLRGHKKIKEYLSRGISIGGLIVIIIGLMQFWGQLSKKVQFVVGIISLVALIYIGNKYSKKFTFND